MYKLVMNDSTTYALASLPYEDTITKKGVQKRVWSIPFGKEITTIEQVKTIVNDELKSSNMKVLENDIEVAERSNYTVLEQITTGEYSETVDGEETTYDILIAKVSQSSTIPEQILALEDQLKAFNAAVNNLSDQNASIVTDNTEIKENLNAATTAVAEIQKKVADVNEDDLSLEDLKAYRIAQSKVNLANYLATHPVTSTAHKNTEASYSITQEKQSLLVSMIMMCTINPDYQPSWNATGEACTYDWTLEELQTLAADIEAVVRPLVSKQQSMEVEINAASTIAAVKKVSITF
jgi:hypothetical protein